MDAREWLGQDNELGYDIWNNKYRYNNETLDEWFDRVSGGYKELRQLIVDKKFLFGGRVLANRGINGTGNYYNCFSYGFVDDDYSKIMDALKEVGITFKVQGGQGVSLSKLRPSGTPIGEQFATDGIVPFMQMFNAVTEGTSQAGSRKGALMISLDIRHKEAEKFITIKTDLHTINKANLSLEIDDEFMEAVKKYYDTGETVVLHECRTYSGHTIEYDVTPINLYKKMMEVVWDYGEPGCIFTTAFRNYNFLQYDDNYQIETSNPCGEQPLKAKSCCNLGSLNLYAFVNDPFTDNAEFDFDAFTDAIYVAGQALDYVIDENAARLPDALSEYRANAKRWRNQGLGVFGYADMLMALGMTYGSHKAQYFTDKLFNLMMRCAIKCNIARADLFGAYPACKMELVKESEIYKKHAPMIEYALDGFRNCSLLSIAPSGSISTMLGRSGGIEPQFALSYTRRTDNLKDSYSIDAEIVKEYKRITGKEKLPSCFVTSSQIPWRARVETQGIIQSHIDTAISSTVNLPQDTTVEEIEKLYLYAWQCGCKGITIFRDGCKRLGILTTHTDNNNEDDSKSEKEIFAENNELKWGDVIAADDDVIGLKRKLVTGCGTLHVECFFDAVTGDLMETFFSKGSTGGCLNSLNGLSRMISISARAGIALPAILDQLRSSGTCPSYAVRTALNHNTSKGSSCPVAISYAIEEMADEAHNMVTSGEMVETPVTKKVAKKILNPCPNCGAELSFEGGCITCHSCGYSKCE